jgi:polysaccharide pyruvyl transferase WcaK-like protein
MQDRAEQQHGGAAAGDVASLDPAAACEAHVVLAGRPTRLDGLLQPGARFRVPVTPETLLSLESLHLLAAERGARIDLALAEGLNAREEGFLEDFRLRFLNEAIATADGPGPLSDDALSYARSLAGMAASGGLPRSRLTVPDRLGSAVLIGAYGGDHVGDAAILGGVLLGLHRDHGITRACILSQRPGHTARLAAALETPVEVTVRPYDYATLRAELDRSDALAFAGGPLMDLPRMLVKHLAAARMARAARKPFLICRVGVGPFSRRISAWTARLIAAHADMLSVRTSGAARHPVLRGLEVQTGRDPAFDYLESRGRLTRLTGTEQASVERLLEGTEGRVLIGLNIRPIRHEWSHQGKDFSRDAEEGFNLRLSEVMAAVSAAAPRPVTWVFFPMNPIQLGSSDLAAAWRLHRLVGARADLRVWEADPDVDGVLHLLRRLDGAVAMRFHAAIFCLSQGVPTIGIDYYPGQGGKVEQLFHDFGLGDDVRRIDTSDADWMRDRLARLAGAVPGARKQFE